MKKLIVLIIFMALFFSKSFAMQAQLKSLGEHTIDVLGTCINNKNYQEILLNVPGMDTVKMLSENTIFSGKSNNSEDDSLRVVIIPINEDEIDAYKWFIDETAKIGNEIKGYYLAFYRDNTPTLPKGKVAISFDLISDNKHFNLYHMNGDGKYKEVDYLIKDNKIIFQMVQSGYYIISKVDPPVDIPSDTIIDSPNNILNIFKTGDSSATGFYTLTFLISSTIVAFTGIKNKKHKEK